MDRFAILFPSAEDDISTVRSDFANEYAVCSNMEAFFPVLYNEGAFATGAQLELSSSAPAKTMFYLRRGRTFPDERTWTMEHALKRCGYKRAFGSVSYYSPYWMTSASGSLDLRAYRPEILQPYHRYWRSTREGFGWFPDLHVFERFLPAVAKNSDTTLRDENGNVRTFEHFSSWKDIDTIVQKLVSDSLERFNDTYWSAPMWFEKKVDIANVDGVPVEWRAFCLEGRVLMLTPKCAIPTSMNPPAPPKEHLEACSKSSCFSYIDLAMDTSGRWWVLKVAACEHAPALGIAPAQSFYSALAQAIEDGPREPEWVWCLAANVVSQHEIGEEHVIVEGSRHFLPGTKVYCASMFWGMGGERCTVIGVPKYSDYPIGVVMRTDHLVDFRLERVTDPKIIKALCTNRLKERFERHRSTVLIGERGNRDEDKEEIERLAKMFNDQAG